MPAAHAAKRRYAPWVYEAISAGKQFHFRNQRRWLHNATNLAAIAMIALAVGLLLEASMHLTPWIYLPVGGVGFGLLYFALFILVVHEASHGMLLLSANRRLELWLNRISGWSVCLLFATHYGKHWERGHREHHLRPLEADDPQRFSIWVGPSLRAQVLKTLFIPGFLFYARTVGRAKTTKGKSSSSKPIIVAFVAIWVCVLTTVTLTYGWAAALALFLGIHVLQCLNAIKGGLEHGGAIGQEANPFVRSRTTLFFGRHLLMPLNISLHFEHHLNFTVPWYDLGRYHETLETIVPPEVWRCVVNRSPLAQLRGELGGLSSAAVQALANEENRPIHTYAQAC